MDREKLKVFIEKSREGRIVEENIAYLTEHMEQFLQRGERVLICFHRHEYGNISYLMEQAVLRCGAFPVLWNDDMRWINLLRLAFTYKTRTVIGAPMVVLGLSKVARERGVPLYIHNAVIAGYPAAEWFKKGIAQGFDCKVWDCFSLWLSGVVCGFSCRYEAGIHLRENIFGMDIIDPDGKTLPEGKTGEVVIYSREDPTVRLAIGEYGTIDSSGCLCGDRHARLVELMPGKNRDPEERKLGQLLQSWSSVLDCRLNRTQHGMELEIVYFQGERLPELPSVAKLILRPWDPETDKPFWFMPFPEYSSFFEESH